MKSIVSLICAIAFIHANSYATEVVELKKPSSNKVVVRLMFHNGSIADPAGKEGLTALTALMVAKGATGQHTRQEIDSILFPMAATVNVSTDKEVSNFTFQVPVDFLEQFYPLMKNAMLDPAFSEKDFNRFKAQQLNFVTKGVRNSSDEDYSKLALEDFLYRGTNYQHMVAGTEAGLEAITLGDVRAHYKKYFTQDNLLIGIAGNYDGKFKDRLKGDLQKLPELETALPVAEQAEMPDGVNVEVISKPGAFGSAIFMGFPLEVTREDGDFAALMIANSYLGEHRKSYGRLYNEIREKRSMNYGDYSYIEWYPSGSANMLPPSGYPRSTQYFSIWIRPVQIAASLKQQHPELADIRVGHAHFAIRMALLELDQLITNGMGQEDFELTKQFLRSYIKLYINNPMQELGYRMDAEFYGREDWISEIDRELEQVTLEDVNAAVQKYLQVEDMNMAIITSPDEAQVLAESLRTNAVSPMSYSNTVKEGLTGDIFEKDEQVEKYPLNIKSVSIVPRGETFQ